MRFWALRSFVWSSRALPAPPVFPCRSEEDPYSCIPHVSGTEARLLNSLRRMLNAIPEIERVIGGWCGSGAMPRDPRADQGEETPASGRLCLYTRAQLPLPAPFVDRSGPPLGAQFAQLMKELRTEYGAAIKNVVQNMLAVMMAHRAFWVRGLLQGLARPPPQTKSGQPQPMPSIDQTFAPLRAALAEVLEHSSRVLSPRVFVSVTRGLWDGIGREILDYCESLKESSDAKGAWKGHFNAREALKIMDEFVKQTLTQIMGHAMSPRDLDLPWHVERVHKLLAPTEVAVQESYRVY